MHKPLRLSMLAAALAASALLLMAPAASAQVGPGTYLPTSESFNANHPGSANLKSGSPSCTVNSDQLDRL